MENKKYTIDDLYEEIRQIDTTAESGSLPDTAEALGKNEMKLRVMELIKERHILLRQ